MRNQYEEINLGDFKITKDEYDMSIPWAMAFVYSKEGNFLIKGMENSVRKEIDKYAPCHYNFTWWNKDRRKDKPFMEGWYVKLKDCERELSIDKYRKPMEKRMQYQLWYYKHSSYGYMPEKVVVGRWRKVPHKYIKELTELNLMFTLDTE